MKSLFVLIFISLAFNSFTQDEVIDSENKEEPSLAGYFSFETKLIEIHSDKKIYSGIKFGIIKNHNYSIGLAGYELSGKSSFKYIDNQGDVYNFKNEIDYGGLTAGYTFFPELPFHISTALLLGGGKISIKEDIPLNHYEFDNAHNREDNYWATVEDSRINDLRFMK